MSDIITGTNDAEEGKMISLRPHHLLCIQHYAGKGYSEDFVRNMDSVTGELKAHPTQCVRFVFPPMICAPCFASVFY